MKKLLLSATALSLLTSCSALSRPPEGLVNRVDRMAMVVKAVLEGQPSPDTSSVRLPDDGFTYKQKNYRTEASILAGSSEGWEVVAADKKWIGWTNLEQDGVRTVRVFRIFCQVKDETSEIFAPKKPDFKCPAGTEGVTYSEVVQVRR